jgi:plastocyanin
MAKIHLALLALSLGFSSACGSYSSPSNSQNPPPPAAMTNDVGIVIGASALTTTAFSPNPKVVSLAGNPSVTVRWINKDISNGDYAGGTATVHNVTSDNGAFTASGNLGGNATFSTTLSAAGDYAYHCAIHPNMVGMITVTP